MAISALMLSCSSSSKPEKVARHFTESLAVGKIDEAKKYATEPTKRMLDLMSSLGGSSLPIEPDFEFEAIKDSIVGKKAWITFKNQEGEIEILELVKIDGEWLVHMEVKK